MNRNTSIIALALTLGVAALATDAQAAPDSAAHRSCFSMRQLESTRPDGDQRIYARVNLHDVYRLDLAFRCPALTDQEGIVLVPAGGEDNICGPLDLDLRAREVGGGSTPCMIKSITKLTAEEAAALPPKVKP